MNKTVINGYLIRYSYGFNQVNFSIYINKRKGQVVKTNMINVCTTQYDYYTRVDAYKSSLGYKSVRSLLQDVMDNLEVTHYIDIDGDRASYELSRALSC